MLTLRRGNDQILQLPQLRTTQIPPVFLNTAQVIGTLVDGHGKIVLANLIFEYVVASEGTYELPVDGAVFMLPSSTLYKLIVVGKQNDFDFRVVCPVTVTD